EVPSPAPIAPKTPSKKKSKRRSQIGPRLTFVVQARFWAEVLKGLGEAELAQETFDEAQALLDKLQGEARVARPERTERDHQEEMGLSPHTRHSRFRAVGL